MTPAHPFRAESVLLGHRFPVCDCAITPDGSIAISASYDFTARVWDLSTGSTRAILKGHTHSVLSCSLSADGAIAATASTDGSVRVWDASAGRCLGELRRDGFRYAFGCALTANGRTLAACFQDLSAVGLVVVYSWASGSVQKSWCVANGALSLAMSENGSTVALVRAAANGQKGVSVLDTRTGQELRDLLVTAQFWPGIAIDAAGEHVAVSDDKQLQVFSTRVGSCRDIVLCTYLKPGYTNYCAITGDCRRVMAAMAGDTFGVWDVQTGALISLLAGHDGDPRGCAIAADGNRAITGSDDNTLRVWGPGLFASLLPAVCQRDEARVHNVVGILKHVELHT